MKPTKLKGSFLKVAKIYNVGVTLDKKLEKVRKFTLLRCFNTVNNIPSE